MGMRRWVGVLSVAVLTVFAGAAPALGTSALLPNSVISSARARASEPAVAVSAGGRTLAAWVAVRGELETDAFPSCGISTGYGKIEARLGTAAHGWRGVQVLGTDGESPMAAVGANGTAAVAWCPISKSRGSLYVSIASPGRPFGRPMLVRTSGQFPVGAPQGLKVQPDGRVVLIWSKTLEYAATVIKSRVEFALLGPHGGRPVIGVVSKSGPGEVSVAETEDGDVLVAFPDLSAPTQKLAQLHPTARAFAAPQTIPQGKDATVRTASVSAGPGGAALAFTAWGLAPPYMDENEMAEQQPNGTFGSPVRIFQQPLESTRAATSMHFEPTGGGAFEPEDAVAAFPAGGARVAVWRSIFFNTIEVGGVGPEIVMAAVRPVGAASFQAPVRLSVGAGRSGKPLIASAGTATLVLWVQDEPGCRQRVYTAVGAVGTALAQVRALSGRYVPAKGECGTGSGQLALAGSGRYAIAGWVQNSALHITTIPGGIVANTSRAARASSRPSALAPGSRR
jgi:hypothetical protein